MSDRSERDFYRDYEKLYSRFFPVYDKPKHAGDFGRDMTLRPMQRYYKSEPDKSELYVSFFPEGGHLIEGVENRVAFEATWSDGESANGWLCYGGDTIAVQHNGRGVLRVTPREGSERKAIFLTDDKKERVCTLPESERDGVADRKSVV